MKLAIATIALAALFGQSAATVTLTAFRGHCNVDGKAIASQTFDHYPGHELSLQVGGGDSNGADSFRIESNDNDGLYAYGGRLFGITYDKQCPTQTEIQRGSGCIWAPANCLIKEIFYGRD